MVFLNKECKRTTYDHGNQNNHGFQYSQKNPYRHFFLLLRSIYFLTMLQMDSHVTCSKYDRANKHQNITAIDTKQEKNNDRKSSPCNRDSKDSSVEILHGLFTLKIPDPEYLIKNHAQERDYKYSSPEVPSLIVKIRKNECHRRYDKLPGPLQNM